MSSCNWCMSRDSCKAESPSGYLCTREPGHPGIKHVACGTNQHPISTWDEGGEEEVYD